MRLFKRNSSRADRDDETPRGEKGNSPNLSGLFVDSPAGTETYVDSPQEALAAGNIPNPNKGPNVKALFTSPMSQGDPTIDHNLSLELAQHGNITEDSKLTGQDSGDGPGNMNLRQIDSFDDEPSSRKGVLGSGSPTKPSSRKAISRPFPRKPPMKQSPRRGGGGLRTPISRGVPAIEGFEAAFEDDETFMIEEATRRDIKLFTNKGDVADIETASVLFSNRNRGRGKSETVDMSAEEILRTQRWGRSPAARMAPGRSPAARSPAARSPLPGSPGRRSRGKRPPPLVQKLALPALDSPTSSNLHSNVFGRDGGFMTDGFRITSDGILHQPDIDLREDNVKTLRGGDNFSSVQMRSLNEFRSGPTIGAGAAGRVYIALHEPTSLAVAMKSVNVFDKGTRSQFMKELLTLSKYSSRYLVRFYGAFYDGKGAVHTALEFMDRGCLDSFVKKNGAIPEQAVRVIAVDCLRGLRFLHKHHVMHRDFKTANILLSREQCCAKISDFGLARDVSGEVVSRVDTFVGTVAYMSPERLTGGEYTYAGDIWAFGVSLAECFLGRYPFEKPQNFFDYLDTTVTTTLFDKVGEGELSKMSDEAKDFIITASDSVPEKRPTAEQLLKHPWLKDFVPNTEDRKKFGEWIDKASGTEDARKKMVEKKPVS